MLRRALRQISSRSSDCVDDNMRSLCDIRHDSLANVERSRFEIQLYANFEYHLTLRELPNYRAPR